MINNLVRRHSKNNFSCKNYFALQEVCEHRYLKENIIPMTEKRQHSKIDKLKRSKLLLLVTLECFQMDNWIDCST